jgi:ribosome biogenesis protein Tsr3
LVSGKSARKYTDEQKVYDVLTEQYDPNRVATRKLLSITALEQEIGPDAFRMQGLVVKPNGKPTLVPDRDVRPESYVIVYQEPWRTLQTSCTQCDESIEKKGKKIAHDAIFAPELYDTCKF